MVKSTDYLCIEPYLRNFTTAQALRVAFNNGLIDQISVRGTLSLDALMINLRTDPSGLRLLCEMLASENILAGDILGYSISDGFRKALNYRDLLEAKLSFANLLAPDLIEHFQDYVEDFSGFMERSRVFELFRYDRCYQNSPDNLASTRTWMRYTTALTRHEAPVCIQHHDFSRYRSIIDVGGNSGEFVWNLCRAYPELRADVFDLPVVCEVGREHVQGSAEASRIRFLPGDIVNDVLPTGYDMVVFKSMLHDWPREGVELFLDKALSAIKPDGTILIFERGPLDLAQATSNYGLLPMLLFSRNFRSAQIYAEALHRRGLHSVEIEYVELDTPFFILAARRS